MKAGVISKQVSVALVSQDGVSYNTSGVSSPAVLRNRRQLQVAWRVDRVLLVCPSVCQWHSCCW